MCSASVKLMILATKLAYLLQTKSKFIFQSKERTEKIRTLYTTALHLKDNYGQKGNFKQSWIMHEEKTAAPTSFKSKLNKSPIQHIVF
jgi:hypothetical protein